MNFGIIPIVSIEKVSILTFEWVRAACPWIKESLKK